MKKCESYDRATCPMEYTMNEIAGKWKLVILWHIYDSSVIRYGELRQAIGSISHKMLSDQLKELVQSGIVHKQSYNEIPPRVEYSLTPKGVTLIPILDMMYQWGEKHRIKQ